MIFDIRPEKTIDSVHASLIRFAEEINRFHRPPRLWPVFADDAAAAAANLKVGYPYVTPDGFLKRRMA